MRYAIVDIETTGNFSRNHSITEIAIIIHDGKKILDTFQSLVNPETTTTPFVSRLTGITNAMLQDAPKFFEIAKKVWDLTEDAVFVAHSVNFDYSYIHEEFKSLGADFKRKKLCTVRLSRKLFPGYPTYSLGSICASLEIPFANRHRAMGDAAATAKLFELCVQADTDDVIKKMLTKNSKEALLPPNLPKDVYDNLPERTGVYYMHDVKGKVIYVGKAINIKSRIYSHFTGKGSRLSFVPAIANITYQLCGTELIALLLESEEIKRIYPQYNVAQKFSRGNYVLTDYMDQKGVHHLLIAKNHPSLKVHGVFKSFEAAREGMYNLMAEFDLCPKYCGIQIATGACFDYQVRKCKGVCAGNESEDEYNKRVVLALKNNAGSETNMIIDQGRTLNEKSVVLIEDGVYKGFGYFNSQLEIKNTEHARDFIMPFKNTADAQRILNGFTSISIC